MRIASLFCCFLFICLSSFAFFPVTVTTTAASCPGVPNGSITVTPGGGVAPYLYSLNGSDVTTSNIFSGIVSGNYVVTVMDATNDVTTVNTTVFAASAPESTTLNLQVCSNQLPVVFGGNSIYNAGVYRDTLMNIGGCDSVVTLYLTVIAVVSSTENAQVCTSQLPYIWNNQSYNAAGVYNIVFPGSGGCDSVATLQLSVTNSNQWIGTTSTVWEIPGNWSCGAVPGPTSDVIINSGTVVIHANTTINTLSVSSNANLTVSSGVVFTVLH